MRKVTKENSLLKRGMILKYTKVTVEVFGLPVIRAEKSKIILRENFSVTSLEEKLLSMGIAGMGRTIMNMIHQAFRSRLVSRVRAKRSELKHIRGLLLYGPPGTGKTMTARALCKLLRAKKPLVVNGPEVFNSLYGIRRPTKRGGSGFKKQENRVVSQLLTMMDGFDHLNSIFVIGTTNREDLLDDALMRNGRMELNFELGYPTKKLGSKSCNTSQDKMRRYSPIDDDVDLREVARRTNGCSAAALSSLVQLASVKAEGVPNDDVYIMGHVRATLTIRMSHYLLAAETLVSGHRA